MALTENQLKQVFEKWMRIRSEKRKPIPFSKPVGKTIVSDLYTFLESNRSAINSAIQQPGRGQASTRDKLELLAAIALLWAESEPE